MPLWLRRNNNTGTNSRTMQVTLANTVTGTIGSATQTLTTLPSSGSPALVNFVIPNPATATFPAGSAFRVTITQTRAERRGPHARSCIPSARRPAATAASC